MTSKAEPTASTATDARPSDRIEKTIDLNAPVSRVWRALTDTEEFGTWFRCKFDGPFVAGQVARASVTIPNYEHLKLEATVVAMQAERYFSYTWHPYACDPSKDYSHEPPTLVEFRLEPIATGTRLVVTESGFDKIPSARRDEAFRMNTGGWDAQVRNIARHVGHDVGQVA